MKKYLLMLIVAMWLTGCQLTDTAIWLHSLTSHDVPETTLTHVKLHKTQKRVSDPVKVVLIYQFPDMDAEIAASVKDFRLLGYQTLTTAYVIPATPDHYTQQHIERGCGIRLLPGAASVKPDRFGSKQRQTIRDYIEHYNRIMLGYCENNAGKKLRPYYPGFSS